MKTIEEIINQPAVFVGNFSDEGDVWSNFQTSADKHGNCKLLFAAYGYGCYDGAAFVLVEKNGELYEVNGGHCSCYGLEDQFALESVVLKELEKRVNLGMLTSDWTDWEGANAKLKEFLGINNTAVNE